MKFNIVASIALAVVMFFAGWVVNGWRLGKQVAEEQTQQVQQDLDDTEKAVEGLRTRIVEVVTKSEAAAANTQSILDNLVVLRTRNNQAMEQVSAQTERLSNEIKQLGAPKCTFDFTTGRLWRTIGEGANQGRSALYGTDARSED